MAGSSLCGSDFGLKGALNMTKEFRTKCFELFPQSTSALETLSSSFVSSHTEEPFYDFSSVHNLENAGTVREYRQQGWSAQGLGLQTGPHQGPNSHN